MSESWIAILPSRATESRNQNNILEVLNRQADSKGQRLILLIDQESAKILKRMNLVAYTGVDKGLFKILSDSSGGKAGTTLTADQDESAMEPMDV